MRHPSNLSVNYHFCKQEKRKKYRCLDAACGNLQRKKNIIRRFHTQRIICNTRQKKPRHRTAPLSKVIDCKICKHLAEEPQSRGKELWSSETRNPSNSGFRQLQKCDHSSKRLKRINLPRGWKKAIAAGNAREIQSM